MIPLTDEEISSYKKKEVCYICKKEFSTDNDIKKVRNHCHCTGKYIGAAHSIFNLRQKTSKEIPAVLQIGYTYDFIIEELVKKIGDQFECL